MSRQIKLYAWGMAALLATANAEAAVCTTNAGTGAWGTAATWSCGHVPISTDTVVISRNITLSATSTIAGLTVDAGATLSGNNRNLTVGGPVSISGTYNTGGGNLTTTGGGALTVNTGGTFDFTNGNAAIGGNVAIDGTLSSGGDAIQMTGASTTLSGSGTIGNTDVEIDALGISLPAGSTLDFANNAQLRVGSNNQATFTLDGAITTGATWTAGDRIVRVYQNSSMTINGLIDAPDAYIRLEQNASVTNNGTVAVQYLRTDAVSSVWTQGNNSSLVMTVTAPAGDWNGVLDASATGNTVTYNGTATPLTPSSSYYNLAGTAVTCPHGFAILGSDPCPAGGPISVTLSPSACANVAGIGTQVWSTLTGPLSSNNAYATASLGDNQTSNYLQCTGYNFAIPAGATINGITVNVERKASNTPVRDAAMRLVKDVAGVATIQATDRADTLNNYPVALDATAAYGSTVDLWGAVWTPADINTVNFGAALASMKAGTAGGARTASVDHMPITVTYTVGAAGPHHIEIDHDGGGLTCSAETVTIKACADNLNPCTPYTGGVDVTLTPGGQIFAIDATGINSAASVQQSTAGSATLSAVSVPAATDATPTTCWNTATSTASCAMTFSDSGFVVTAPDHVSCNNALVTIEAVQTAPGTGRCVPAYQSVTRAVNLYTAYASPVTGTMVATASADGGTNWFAVSTSAPGAAQNLVFDASGTAMILLNYQDAGQLTLTASGTAPTGKAMSGSGTFVVAPASFVFSGIPAPLVAGQAFNATVTAMNACATPATTPNFTAQTVTITSSNPQPALGNATAINASLTATSGTGSANLTWDEVGTIDLNASLSAYLGSTLSISGAQAGVGSFRPDHFDTAAVTGLMPCPAGLACPASNGAQDGFIYSGQPFTVQVIARNLAGGTTANYAGAFARATTLAAWDALGSTATQNPGGGVLANNAVAAATFAAGVATLATPTYTFAAATAPTNIFMRATDTDGVTSLRAVPADSVEGGVTVANGRIRLTNAHGSELLLLPLTATVQYFNGTNWVASATDGATSFNTALSTAGGNLVAAVVTGLTGGVAVAAPGAAPVVGGIRTFSLNPPGQAGSVSLTINAPAYLPGNTARATFGVYKGNDEFIYMRENY